MLTPTPFYHGIIRKTIVAFGSLFSNIMIDRKDNGSVDGNIVQRIKVPVAYAPKEKWLVRVDQDPNLDKHTYGLFPVISFEITGYSYDASRKLNRMNQISCYKDGEMTSTRVPVPYNVDISVYVISKTQEDVLQIVEQILPYFNPDYNLNVKMVPETNTYVDVPVILNSVSANDEYDGDFQTRRIVTYTLNFTAKIELFGPVNGQSVIDNVTINMNSTNFDKRYNAYGDEVTGVITEDWMDGF